MTAPAHTLIYTHGGGRLGNQVLRFLHWMAWVRDHPDEVEVVNFAFWPFASLFAHWRQQPGCVFPPRVSGADGYARRFARLPAAVRALGERRRLFARGLQAAGRVVPGWQAIDLDIAREESIDLDDPAFLQRVKRRRVTTCCGWKIASWKRVAAQEAELRELFQPAPEFIARARSLVDALRETHDRVVGIFIRQSDYRQWHDGRFLFPATLYRTWMQQVLELEAGKRVAFVVASEVWHHPALFAGLPVHFATGSPNGGGHWFESWVELARCDVIVTPPSTFSATAAFLGDVPLWPVTSWDQVMARDQQITNGLAGAARHPEFSLAVK